MPKHIHLISFQINSPMNHTVLSWARPDDNRLKAMADMKLWIDMAQTLERGLCDALFFADTRGVFDRCKDRVDEAIRYGVCWPTMDPITLLGAIAGGDDQPGPRRHDLDRAAPSLFGRPPAFDPRLHERRPCRLE